jgi:HK97 family phage portal protein
MRLFGLELTRARTSGATPVPVRRGGWWPIIREPSTGAWQRNEEIAGQTALSYTAVFACTTLIAQDIGKLRLRLVERDGQGIWSETTAPAFSPVLRKPNRYQIINKFIEQWLVSKLVHGNTYVLKQRDERHVVVALYVLDPQQVTPLVAPDGAVFYELRPNELAGLAPSPDSPGGGVAVPAREIIHDLMVPLFHPLVGVSPIYACGAVALQGLRMQDNSTSFFANGSAPGGVITVPGSITEDSAKRLGEYWNTHFTGPNVGKVALLSDGMKYDALSVNATDAQLIEQLKWTVEQICSAYHVPAALIDSSHQPPYANSEPLVQQYFSQCLQALIVALENSLDEGLGLTTVPDHVYGTEFDIDDLIWLDMTTRSTVAEKSVHGGVLSPDEARAKYYGVGAVAGGDTPYMQQQMFSLRALSIRDQNDPFSKPAPSAPAVEAEPDEDDEDDDLEMFTKGLMEELYVG